MAETSSNYRQPSSPSISSPTSAPYYGLATQLRTPPTDFSPTFPMSKSLSSSSTSNNLSTSPSLPSKKLTPAMRDEFGFAPKYVPQWSSKGESASSRNGNEDVWVGGGSEEGTPQSLAPLPRSSPKQSRASGRHSTAPRPMHAPHLSTSTQKHGRNDSLRDTPVFGKVDFSFKPMQQPLDLTVTLDPVQSTTYQTSYENKSMPNVQRNFRIDEQDEMPLPMHALPTRGGSLSSRHKSPRQTDSSLKSPSLESASPRKFQAPPSPSSRPPPPTLPDSFAAAFPLSRTITPASKGSMNLITLARRTTHLAEVPGYGWRLNLLEKLEVLTGSFIAIRDAESILSIGQGQKTALAPSKLESRKSQIFLPTTTTTSESSKLTKSRPTKGKEEPKSFFGKMRRALSNPGSPHTKDTPPPVPPPKRVVFGQKLSQVAEYAFVTSMIAGQRHDLPGVCFSSVEEIYRRGQGSKVPGLLQLAGEPGRVSRLVQIFDAGPDYGEHHDLSVESIHNVCSLLKKYLHDLPEPVLDERVYRLFLAGCVDSTNPHSRRVASAQIILRLLPTANFSLLVYLVAFLSQVPLFPSNPLTLEVVSEIFASSIMAPRQPPSASSTHGKKPKGHMIITGPTDLVDDVDGKKANQGLAWLLKNWSAVADGLLEPDFDIDVDSIVAACSPIVPQPSPQPELVQQLAPPTPTSPTMAHNFDMPSTPRAAPTPPNGGFSTFPPPPIPFVEPVSEVPEEQASTPMSDVPKYLNSLDDDDEEEDDEAKSDEEMARDQSQTKTPRPQSDSSYATSIETPPAGDFGDHRTSMKRIEPAQLSPEDERGPLDLSHNIGDDVVEFDDYSSVYSFPAPPTSLPSSTYHHRLPSLPPSPFLTQDEIALALAEQDKAVHSSTIPQSSTFAPLQHYDEEDENDEQTEDLDLSSSTMSPAPPQQAKSPVMVDLNEFEPKRLSVSNLAAPHLVRSKSTQLEESRTLVLQQRMEIQSLWEKLTGLESERLREREEMIGLTNEVEGFKQSLRKQVEEVNGGEQLRAELEHVREELRISGEERKKEQVKAKEQVESLEKQLADIRKVLIPLLGSSIQV